MAAETTHAAVIRDALEVRRVRKEEIREMRIEVDRDFATIIKSVRDAGAPWKEIVDAAGMSRQMLNELLREHCS